MFKNIIPNYIRTKALLCVGVITLSVFTEALGLSVIMPLLASIIEGQSSGLVGNFLEKVFGISSTIEFAQLIIFLFICKFALLVWKNYLMYGIEWSIRANWMSSIYKFSLSKDYLDFEQEKPGYIFNNITNETLKAASAFRQSMEYIAQILQIVALASVLLISEFTYAVTTLSVVGVVLILIKVSIINRGRDFGILRQQHEEVASHETNEMIHGMKTIRFYSLEDFFSKRFDQTLSKLVKLMRKTEVIKRLPIQITEIVVVILVSSYIVYAEIMQISLVQKLPFLGMMLVVSIRLFSNAGSLAANYMAIKVLWISVERISYLTQGFISQNLKSKSIMESIENPKIVTDIECIDFDDVSFQYVAGSPVISGLNISFKNNSLSVITGESGSGKSTIVKLIMKLYEPSSGSIKVGKTSIADINNNHWRSEVGYVDQDHFFFYGTIRENITLGSKDFSDKEIERALVLTYSDLFISELPMGLDTFIGDKGNLLSGGQKARLSLTRAIIARPKLLILDEVTSALDKETKKYISKAILKLRRNMLIIAISHDDDLIEVADYLFRMDNGALHQVT